MQDTAAHETGKSQSIFRRRNPYGHNLAPPQVRRPLYQRFQHKVPHKLAVPTINSSARRDSPGSRLYPVESEGIVVPEALAHGLPVIAFDRGCIAVNAADSGGLVLPPDGPFLVPALHQIEAWLQDPGALRFARSAAMSRAQQTAL